MGQGQEQSSGNFGTGTPESSLEESVSEEILAPDGNVIDASNVPSDSIGGEISGEEKWGQL